MSQKTAELTRSSSKTTLPEKVLIAAALILGLVFVIGFVFPYFRWNPQQFNFYWPKRGWLVLHMAGGAAALLLGPFVLSMGLNRRRMALHRQLGIGYMTSIGLSSIIGQSTSNKVTGNDMLKAILGVQQQQAPQSTYASIYTVAPMSNTFKMSMKFVSANKKGPLNIGPYQGASASSGYRLVYQPGNETGLVLQRIIGNQVTQVGSYNDPVNLEDNKVHELLWSREASGKMRVYVDGQQLIIATDTQIQGNLDGWLNVNQGGAYWIREIKVVGL